MSAHTTLDMSVTDAELRAAMVAVSAYTADKTAKELTAEGWFSPAAVAKARDMRLQPAENFCSLQVRNGTWEKARGRMPDGRVRKFYRPIKQKKGARK